MCACHRTTCGSWFSPEWFLESKLRSEGVMAGALPTEPSCISSSLLLSSAWFWVLNLVLWTCEVSTLPLCCIFTTPLTPTPVPRQGLRLDKDNLDLKLLVLLLPFENYSYRCVFRGQLMVVISLLPSCGFVGVGKGKTDWSSEVMWVSWHLCLYTISCRAN